jgi:glycosyltransferase involved in cell wall biosynthesis
MSDHADTITMECRVCFFQCYYTEYIRSQTLLEGLHQHEVNIAPCIVNQKSLFRYPKAIYKLLKVLKDTDVIVANFRCWELLPLLRIITRKPIIYDAHISIWQSYCEERKKCKTKSIIGKLLYFIDRYNCRIADMVIVDTKTHAQYFSRTFGVPIQKLLPVYISCEASRFRPRTPPGFHSDGVTRVFWAGSGIPLQGLEVIMDAMKLLGDFPIHLRIAGSSPIIERMKSKAKAENIYCISFLGRVTRDSVIEEIASADICLGGHYSSIPKARNVIAGKLYEMIAMKKPVIAGDSPAVRELFTSGKNILLCKMGEAQSLADAILTLHNQPELRAAIASEAYNLYNTTLNPRQITSALADAIRLAAGK